MIQIFGDFQDNPPTSYKYLIFGFSPSSVNEQWQKKRLSVEFIGDYLTTFFPIVENEPNSLKKRRDVRDTTKYIANELLENAMKFNDYSVDAPVVLRLFLYQSCLLFYVTNTLIPEIADKFINQLPTLNSQPEVFEQYYVDRLTTNGDEESCLGILTMIINYGAKCGWKFETIRHNPEVTTVTTMVQVNI